MAAVFLTDAYLKGLTPPASGRQEIADTKARGLAFRLTSNGVATWTFRYRDKMTGKIERRTLGRFPEMTLARARSLAHVDRAKVTEGKSPAADVRQARAAERRAITFEELVERYLTEHVAKTKKATTAAVEKSNLASARAEWAGRKAKDISRQDVRDFLEARAAKAPVGANRTLVILSALFGWAVERGLLEATPVVKIAKPTKRETPKDRVLTEAEIPILWAAFDTVDDIMAAAFRVLLLTGQRPGQVVAMERGELFDLEKPGNARWQIPASKRKDVRGTKRGPHIVPLPPLAVEIIEKAIAGKPEDDRSPWVFWSFRNRGEAIDRHSLSRALQRIIADLPPDDDAKAAIERLRADRPTPHDFRRTVATQLAALGIRREDRLAVFDHSEGDVHDVHYDRHDRLSEKRIALETWERRLREILGEARPTAEIVPITRGAAK